MNTLDERLGIFMLPTGTYTKAADVEGYIYEAIVLCATPHVIVVFLSDATVPIIFDIKTMKECYLNDDDVLVEIKDGLTLIETPAGVIKH